ncbi:MAG: hypothetical protein RMM08_13390 [Armatimonadota bacterium]|nr:hypothetical protein [bacterium]MDW8322346.1 hypothetical protein [Armatimonadota bacterium]
MFRVVGVETGDHPRREFVVIRNQSLRYENLRGWAVTDESYFTADPRMVAERLYIFREEIMIEPGSYVALCTGSGANHWARAGDGRSVYVVYWGRERPVWRDSQRVMLIQVAHIAPSTIMPQPAQTRG